MKNFKRLIALSGVILLVLLYLSTLIFSLMDSEFALSMFKISIAGTIVIPVLLYAYLMFYRLSERNNEDADDIE